MINEFYDNKNVMFILAQAPRKSSASDFWELIEKYKIRAIYAVAEYNTEIQKIGEGTKNSAYDYWPFFSEEKKIPV